MSRGVLGSGSILRRKRTTSASTLRSKSSSGRLATASRMASRLNTRPGRLTKRRKRRNSPRVSGIASPDLRASATGAEIEDEAREADRRHSFAQRRRVGAERSCGTSCIGGAPGDVKRSIVTSKGAKITRLSLENYKAITWTAYAGYGARSCSHQYPALLEVMKPRAERGDNFGPSPGPRNRPNRETLHAQKNGRFLQRRLWGECSPHL